MPDSLYDRPDLYDLVAPDDPEMTAYYVAEAGGRGRRVLDLACGTGRITLPLAASGASVVGGDAAETMLDRARQAADEQNLDARFVALDIRDFDLHQTFDAVVIAANSLLHLHKRDDFARFFTMVRRHLAPGGRLLFDIFVPSQRLLSLPPHERQTLASFNHSTLGEITIEEIVRYDAIGQIAHADWFWSRPGMPDFWHTPLQLRQIFPQELPLLIEAGGLRIIARYGDFDRSPFEHGCRRQVTVCALG